MKIEFLKNGMYKGRKYLKGSVVDMDTMDSKAYLFSNVVRIAFNQTKVVIKKPRSKKKKV